MTTTLTLPKWYDLHVHLRQGDLVKPLLEQEIKMGCAGIVAMPNTIPPVEKVFDDEPEACQSIQHYLETLLNSGGRVLHDIIVPLYLTPLTTVKMIERGAKNGLLRACKYYPPHTTTNSEDSADLSYFAQNGIFNAMSDNGIVLCVHGEQHGVTGEDFFGRDSNAETSFYQNAGLRLIDKFPRLKIVAEHVSSKAGVKFVKNAGSNVGATVTPQHLLYTVGDLLQGLKYHLYCLPIVKYQDDREMLRSAVTDPDNTQFFAGTDSAPHTVKITPCCGAAGCYTGGIAPQLYADVFEKTGVDLASNEGYETFKKFLCTNGPNFYGLKIPTDTFTLTKEPQEISLLNTPAGPITPLPIGMQKSPARTATLSWSVKV